MDETGHWVTFLFDRPVPFDWEEVDYSLTEADAPSLLVVREILEDFVRIGRTHTLEQVNQGVWAVFSYPYFRGDLFWNIDLPFAEREATIRTLIVPFRDFLSGHPAEVMENCFFMLWDLIRYHEYHENQETLAEKKEICHVYFEVLSDILSLGDGRCKQSALHGLGHLPHSGRSGLVQEFIDKNTKPGEDIRWLEQCREGTVL